MGFIKLFILAYGMAMGYFLTFGIIAQFLGYEVNAVTMGVCIALAFIVVAFYFLWILEV